jgi:esterase/lipase superfamily enzyme
VATTPATLAAILTLFAVPAWIAVAGLAVQPSTTRSLDVVNVRIVGIVTVADRFDREPRSQGGVQVNLFDGDLCDGALDCALATATTDRSGAFEILLSRVYASDSFLLQVATCQRTDGWGQCLGPSRITEEFELHPQDSGSTKRFQLVAEPVNAVVVAPGQPSDQSTAEEFRRTRIDVFYGTDRTALQQGRFGVAPGRDGRLSLGRIQVSIPAVHKTAEIELPTWFTLERDSDKRFFRIAQRTTLGVDAFYRDLSRAVSTGEDDAALVFIHGYNVDFDTAIYRAAQLKFDLKFKGPVIAYSWPSRASILGYFVDRTNAEWSSQHLRGFLEQIAERSGARRIHVIAHSMGSQVLAYALRDGGRLSAASAPALQEIVLAAPDIDARIFGQIATALRQNAQRITLYASSSDRALFWSKFFNGERRAGDSDAIDLLDGIDYIDASAVTEDDVDILGHSYFSEARVVLEDLSYLIRLRLPPGQRAGLRPTMSAQKQYWTFAK